MTNSRAEVLILCAAVLTAGCIRSSLSHDSVDTLAREYGVPRERVIEVMRAHMVNPDLVSTFGSEPFPLNYYDYQVNEYEVAHGKKPTRSWFEGKVKGYVAKCNSGKYEVSYLFYTDRVHPQWFSEEISLAITAGFDYDNPKQEDAELRYVRTTNLRDGSVNPPDNKFWETCLLTYRDQMK